MNDKQFLLYIIVSAIAAVGTVACAAIALFGSNLKAKCWPPTFEATIPHPEGQKTTLTNMQTGAYADDVRYYHMRIANTRRTTPATDTGLYLIRIEEPGPDGQLEVKWIGDLPIGSRHQNFYPLTRTIGSPIDYDLCSITKRGLRLSLHPIIPGNDLKIVNEGQCDFVIALQVRSSQCESPLIKARLSWNGIWDDGSSEMKKNFKLTILKEPEIYYP